jgi:O-antigen/teichoic acid export membrane protein
VNRLSRRIRGGAEALVGRLRSRAAVDTFQMSGATLLALSLTLAASPVLTRLYPPSEFGLFSIIVAIEHLLVVMVSGRLEWSLPLLRTQTEARHMLAVCFSLNLASFLIIGCVVTALLYAGVLSSPAFLLLPFICFTVGAHQIFSYWVVRVQSFRPLAIAQVLEALTVTSLQVICGYLVLGHQGLLLGFLAGSSLSALFLLKRLKLDLAGFTEALKAPGRALVRRYRQFPLFTAPSSVVNMAGFFLPDVLVAIFFGLEQAGYFSLATRLMGAPAMLLDKAASLVCFSEFAKCIQRQDRRMIRLHQWATIAFLLFGFLVAIVMLWGAPLAGFVFGESWAQAGLYAQLLSLRGLALIPISPLSLLDWYGHSKSYLVWNFARLVWIVAVFSIGAAVHAGAEITVLTYALGTAALYLILYISNVKAIYGMFDPALIGTKPAAKKPSNALNTEI